jgi:hypothetical protein
VGEEDILGYGLGQARHRLIVLGHHLAQNKKVLVIYQQNIVVEIKFLDRKLIK